MRVSPVGKPTGRRSFLPCRGDLLAKRGVVGQNQRLTPGVLGCLVAGPPPRKCKQTMTDPASQGQHPTDNQEDSSRTVAPPRTVPGILRRLGPGLIITGSIVGSGELIATTKTGAQAGFTLLWLIIIGCVIKVFVQVELGRHAISSGETTMASLNQVPGPRLAGTKWMLWYWLIMFIVSLAQLGGIVGGVGQSLATTMPISGDFLELLDAQTDWDGEAKTRIQQVDPTLRNRLASRDPAVRDEARRIINQRLEEQIGPRPSADDNPTWDDIYWATAVTAVTILMLVVGRYGLVQTVSTVLVASFTVVTIFCVFAIQQTSYAFQWTDVGEGLKFHLPTWESMTRAPMMLLKGAPLSPLATALATFGLIGVGANELIAYPYWCLEKGYARFVGRRDDTSQWAERARGWLRVMRWDAMVSMVIYTFATLAFYLLGAAVLFRDGLDPEGNQMIHALSQPYVHVFGDWAQLLFLFGAFAVLYSTFFVANAGHARVASDAMRVFGASGPTEQVRLRWMRAFCVLFPIVSLVFCIFIRHPVQLILASGVMQATMLPMLAGAALYFRYRRSDRRITPGRLWGLMLWLSAAGMLLAGGWIAVTKLLQLLPA